MSKKKTSLSLSDMARDYLSALGYIDGRDGKIRPTMNLSKFMSDAVIYYASSKDNPHYDPKNPLHLERAILEKRIKDELATVRKTQKELLKLSDQEDKQTKKRNLK